MIFIDTNYFLRLLLRDVRKQHNQVRQLFFRAATGHEQLLTSVIVFFELYWVLESFYKKSKPELVNTLTNVLQLDFIRFEERKLLIAGLNIYAKNSISLEDAYNIVYARSNKAYSFGSFDKKLLKVYEHLT